MKTVLTFLIIIFIISCSNFYEFTSQTTPDELHRAFTMDLGNEKLEFKAYNDYYFDTINPSVVYVSKKELKKIKNQTIYGSNFQILFLHNSSVHYLNIMGFYYPDLYLSEIGKPAVNYTKYNLTNGFSYHYSFNGKLISDFYVPYSKGVLRFIAIGNPKWHEKNPDSFWKEIDYVFYVLNQELFKLKTN